MKKTFRAFLCALLAALFVMSAIPAAHADGVEPPIAVQYIALSDATVNMTFLSNSSARCTATATVPKGYTAKLELTLLRDNVKQTTWTGQGTGTVRLNELWNITHGHVYQLVLTVHVYNSYGGYIENPTIQTAIKAY